MTKREIGKFEEYYKWKYRQVIMTKALAEKGESGYTSEDVVEIENQFWGAHAMIEKVLECSMSVAGIGNYLERLRVDASDEYDRLWSEE